MASDPSTSLSGCRVALLSCGQFDPPSYAHLRMFERARDFLVRTMGCKVVEGIMNVAQDTATTHTPAKHRLRMVETAVRKNFWIRAGDFECNQRTPVRQLAVLKHYQEKLSHQHDEPIRVLYVCGSEVLDDLAAVHPDKSSTWNHSEIKELLQKHGLIVLKRGRTHPSHTIYLTDVLREYQKNIHVIEDETFPNNLRCSRIRTALRRGESVRYCLDDDVIEYINEHNLYKTTPDHDHSQCALTSSVVCAHTVISNISSTIRTSCDEPKTSSGSPLRSCTDGLNDNCRENEVLYTASDAIFRCTDTVKYAIMNQVVSKSVGDSSVAATEPCRPPFNSNTYCTRKEAQTIASAKLHTKSSDQPSSSESCRSHEVSEQQLSRSSQSDRVVLSSVQYVVNTSDAQMEPVPSPSSPHLNAQEYTTIIPKKLIDQCTNHVTLMAPENAKISATTALSPDIKCTSELLKGNCIERIPEQITSSVRMKPILSQPKPVADSLLFNVNPSDPEAIPNCVISSVTSEAQGNLRGLADSPAYDNVTLDDLLVATTSWADYLHKESERIGGLQGEDQKELAMPNDQSSSIPSVKEKRRSWFFNRSKSLKDLKPPKEDDTLVRICNTDPCQQKQTSPEILWRRMNQPKGKERWTEVLPPPQPPPNCLRHPEQCATRLRKEPKNISKARDTSDTRLPCNSRMTRSHCDGSTSNDDGVTLRYRCYNLTSTPETTV